MRPSSLLLPLLLAVLPIGARAEAVKVTVYHTNDIHGWIMSRPNAEGRQIGGAPALAAVLAKEKGPRLLLDGGDWWQGTPEGSLSKGAAVADLFNALNYDAVAIGNHEFDAGAGSLKELIGLIRVPVLSANIHRVEPDERVDWVRPWIIKEVAGVKFGLFGLTTTDMGRLSFPENIAGLRFKREVDAAKEAVAALVKEGAQVVIAMTHVGMLRPGQAPFEDDRVIAREVPGIDLIVGGHSHTELRSPVVEERNGTLIVQAGSYLTHVGRVRLEIDPEKGRVVSKSAELVALDPAAGTDPSVQALVDRHAETVGKAFDAVVATASAPMTRGSAGESGLGSWMADCYREEAGTQVGVQNGGGIRADIQKGPVTVRNIFNVMPFDNRLVRLRMKGGDVRGVFDHAVGHRRTGQVSGAAVEYTLAEPPGRRILRSEIAGKPLEDGADYSVVALDFIVAGGDHYASFSKARETSPMGLLARDALLNCARRQGTIAPPPPGRLLAR